MKQYFGPYGGQFVPEVLKGALDELENAYLDAKKDPSFHKELKDLFLHYAGRPTPLTRTKRLEECLGGKARIYLKREDLNHTGAHKLNNSLGQILLTRRMGKKRIIAETGAGQHGVATATAAALFGIDCVIYMGEEDMRRQSLNCFRMRLLGAKVRPVSSGSKTLKDAINEAIRDWVTNVRDTHYILGSALGPHPYPTMVRDFQSIIGKEARKQILSLEKRLPDYLIACVGGGSNSMGLFSPFLKDKKVKMIGVEAGGKGKSLGQHAARFDGGTPGFLHGTRTLILQNKDGQISSTHSISAGLDYPAVSPELAFLHDTKRVRFTRASDKEALDAFQWLSKMEGIIPALESAHAVAYAKKFLKKIKKSKKPPIVIINLSGRGDKDVMEVARFLGKKA